MTNIFFHLIIAGDLQFVWCQTRLGLENIGSAFKNVCFYKESFIFRFEFDDRAIEFLQNIRKHLIGANCGYQ